MLKTSVYVCMYACMHACMHVCMYACMYICMYVHYICTHTHTHISSVRGTSALLLPRTRPHRATGPTRRRAAPGGSTAFVFPARRADTPAQMSPKVSAPAPGRWARGGCRYRSQSLAMRWRAAGFLRPAKPCAARLPAQRGLAEKHDRHGGSYLALFRVLLRQ